MPAGPSDSPATSPTAAKAPRTLRPAAPSSCRHPGRPHHRCPARAGQDAVLVSAGQVTTLLAALDDAAGCKRDRAETCAGCAGQSCTSCQWRLQAAEAYGQLAGTMSHAADAPAVRRRVASQRRPARRCRPGGRAVTRHRTDLDPDRTGHKRPVTT
jgi:hypothetical protein